jgi:hypothetical protein
MFVIQAPHRLVNATTVLPNPEWGDSKALIAEIDLQIAMDGSAFAVTSDSGEQKLQYAWTLTRSKALELDAFINVYAGQTWRLTTHEDEVWIVKLDTDVIDFTYLNACEDVSVVLEFVGKKYGT